MLGYISTKNSYGWSKTKWNKNDFTAFGHQFKSLAGIKCICYMTFVHDLQPLGANTKKKHWVVDATMSRCPCCCEKLETQHQGMPHAQCLQNPACLKILTALKRLQEKQWLSFSSRHQRHSWPMAGLSRSNYESCQLSKSISSASVVVKPPNTC